MRKVSMWHVAFKPLIRSKEIKASMWHVAFNPLLRAKEIKASMWHVAFNPLVHAKVRKASMWHDVTAFAITPKWKKYQYGTTSFYCDKK